MRVCTNRPIVTSQMNLHLICIGWQQGWKHASQMVYYKGHTMYNEHRGKERIGKLSL